MRWLSLGRLHQTAKQPKVAERRTRSEAPQGNQGTDGTFSLTSHDSRYFSPERASALPPEPVRLVLQIFLLPLLSVQYLSLRDTEELMQPCISSKEGTKIR
jgi:hypothetical protein